MDKKFKVNKIKKYKKIYFARIFIKLLLITVLNLGFFLIPRYLYAFYDAMQPDIQVFDSSALIKKSGFLAYDFNFKGGVFVAAGDVDGDGKDEIITGAGPGGGPHVRVFDEKGNYTGLDIFPFHPNFRGGVAVAAGDVDGDGKDELVVGQATLGQTRVKIYEFDKNKSILADFIAYSSGFEGGVHIAVGDINGDGKDEIITGAGAGGGPHVRVFDEKGRYIGFDIFPFHPNFRGGVAVAAGDIDGDGIDEIVVGANRLGTSRVKIYKADSKKTILGDYVVYDEKFKGGVNIACGDIDLDGKDEIVTAANGGGGPHVKLFEHWQNSKAKNLFVYPESFRGGVNIALGDLTNDKRAEIITAPGLGQELRYVVGYSSQGRMIKAVVFGQGLKKTLFVGGTHAGVERNSVSLMDEWIKYLDSHPEVIPNDSQVIVIPNHNPDGFVNYSRYNIFGVDLNRNFGTKNWSPVAYLWSNRVNPGPKPFSESETRALRDFIISLKIDKIISYHSAAGLVSAGELSSGILHPNSLNFAKFYNYFAKYPTELNFKWSYYSLTGDLASWAAQMLDIPSITVELDYGLDWDKNIKAMIEAIKF